MVYMQLQRRKRKDPQGQPNPKPVKCALCRSNKTRFIVLGGVATRDNGGKTCCDSCYDQMQKEEVVYQNVFVQKSSSAMRNYLQEVLKVSSPLEIHRFARRMKLQKEQVPLFSEEVVLNHLNEKVQRMPQEQLVSITTRLYKTGAPVIPTGENKFTNGAWRF